MTSRRLLPALLALAMLAPSAGCFRTTLVFDPARAEVFPIAEITHTYMIGVVGLDGPINLHDVCPNGIARIDQYESLLGAVARSIGGVVATRDAEIHCRADAPAPAMGVPAPVVAGP